jgi:SHS2 domain-containing protein
MSAALPPRFGEATLHARGRRSSGVLIVLSARYEHFDHTADLGVRVFAPTLAALVQPATEGLYAAIGEVVADGDAAAEPIEFDLTADDAAYCLRDYLAEVLFLFERRCCRVTNIDVREFSEERLAIRAEIRPADESASSFQREVKAITYHELSVEPVEGGYQAVYIVDI